MAPTDTIMLNPALTLEHLEAASYTEGLLKLYAAAFANAGYPVWVWERFEQIYQHELSHAELLLTALGSDATQACNYFLQAISSFSLPLPFTDPKSFITLSMALKGTSTSACTGTAQLILNKGALTTAAVSTPSKKCFLVFSSAVFLSICAAEARHDGRVSSAAPKGAARNGPYDMALSVDWTPVKAAHLLCR
ncbi:ferritin-like domain-containing protein [Cytidiella melzeri]|nr:ferritin-like domain-containing protein [Cytidiella melzeri]